MTTLSPPRQSDQGARPETAAASGKMRGTSQLEPPPVLTGDARRPTLGRDGAWTRARVLTAAIAVCVAYFLGAQLGLQLRLPGATPSVLWPPNALLTSALLLVPRRHWPVMILAALPAHLTLSAGTDWQWAMIGLLFLT